MTVSGTHTEAVLNKLVDRVVKTERQYWENAQYSRRYTLEIVGIPNSIDNSVLEETVRGVFKKISVEIDERDFQAGRRLKEKDRTIVKFVNRKNCLQILRVKKEHKSLDPTDLNFPENTKIFINESLCPYYRGIWNKCKKTKGNSENTPVLYDYWFDSCEIGENWSLQNNNSHG